MPDPWGGDNMSDEYAPHTKGAARRLLPENWVKNNDQQNMPMFLASILDCPPCKVHTRPTHENALDDLISAFHDVIHKLFNDACRTVGVPAGEGRDSEVAYEMLEPIAKKLEGWIMESWREQDEDLDFQKRKAQERDQKLQSYHAHRQEANRLARELGLTKES